MQLNEYQALAQRTSRKDISPDDHLFNGILGLAGEAGECADLVKKHYFQDGREVYLDLIDELGDVLWYVVEAVSALAMPAIRKKNEYKGAKVRAMYYKTAYNKEKSEHEKLDDMLMTAKGWLDRRLKNKVEKEVVLDGYSDDFDGNDEEPAYADR